MLNTLYITPLRSTTIYLGWEQEKTNALQCDRPFQIVKIPNVIMVNIIDP